MGVPCAASCCHKPGTPMSVVHESTRGRLPQARECVDGTTCGGKRGTCDSTKACSYMYVYICISTSAVLCPPGGGVGSCSPNEGHVSLVLFILFHFRNQYMHFFCRLLQDLTWPYSSLRGRLGRSARLLHVPTTRLERCSKLTTTSLRQKTCNLLPWC